MMVRLLDINLPAKKFNNVVFPDPDVPKIAVKEWGGNMPVWGWRIVFDYFFTLALTYTV